MYAYLDAYYNDNNQLAISYIAIVALCFNRPSLLCGSLVR